VGEEESISSRNVGVNKVGAYLTVGAAEVHGIGVVAVEPCEQLAELAGDFGRQRVDLQHCSDIHVTALSIQNRFQGIGVQRTEHAVLAAIAKAQIGKGFFAGRLANRFPVRLLQVMKALVLRRVRIRIGARPRAAHGRGGLCGGRKQRRSGARRQHSPASGVTQGVRRRLGCRGAARALQIRGGRWVHHVAR